MSNPRLEAIYRQIPKSTCPPNCGECCGIMFPCLAEIRNIKEWCQLYKREYKDFAIVAGENCPYLGTDKSCTIYEVRPFICRVLGITPSLPCPKCRPSKVINRAVYGYLYKQVYLVGREKPRTEKSKKKLKASLPPGYEYY